ncbi:hypothetical protein [Hymenobacter sp. B81]|uniref:hypothetical protein n=1 Tax=Hymenobacter sp. B81 TaxID=3344878 RepID=UPI0037DC5F11
MSLDSATAALLALRPTVTAAPPAGPADAFLHGTLRPVLKLLNHRLLLLTADFCRDYRLPLASAAPADRQRLVLELLQRNSRWQQTAVGMVTGLLTDAEYDYFRQHRAEASRRLLELLRQRIVSQLPELVRLLPPPDAA